MDAVLDALFAFRPIQQFCALYRKNALVAWRNRRATALRIFAPFLFLLLALLIDRALQANDSNNTAFQNVVSPKPEGIGGIPRCSEDIFIGEGRACKEVLYQPSPDPVIDAIMAKVRANNPVPITVEGFASRADIQTYLYDNPDTVLAAVHFEKAGSNLDGFIVQTNTTVKYFKGSFQHPNKFVQLPLQAAVHREIARYQLNASGLPNASALASQLSFEVSLKEFAHPTIATVSVLGQVLGPFVFAACMFSFVTQISTVVAEKELGLKQALRTMGMADSAYWLSWAVWEVTLAFIVAHSICIYGLILQFDLFLNNNYGLLFFLFFLFQLAMSSMALFIAAFIRRTQVAVYLGFTIFIVGWIMQTVVLFGVPYSPDYYMNNKTAIVTVIFSMLPWDLLAKGFTDLGAATIGANPGLKWSQRGSYCKNIPNVDEQPPFDPRVEYRNYECVMSLNTIYGALLALWGGYFLLAVYFDNIVANEFGVKKPFYYIFSPSYWLPRFSRASNNLRAVEKQLAAAQRGQTAGRGPHPPPSPADLDEDVRAEEDKIKALLQHRTGTAGAMALQSVGPSGSAANAVEVYGLTKLYRGGGTGCCGCCGRTEDFWAIQGSWFSIEQGQLFCLLGPNGAGKTTTINCLTGAIPPTGGEALMYEEPISNSGGLDRIRAQMGVCPQFDILWNELSGDEHLSIYGHVKGLPRRKVASEISSLLDKVKLTYAAGQRAGAYSGGMKRRLSVAIALLGDPRIVYLDEPTTGMDPISRRYVWDIIQESKPGRAIVLTTHSMEEADILGDRIAIMARGKLRCIGTSLRLKQRFGSGYSLAVSVTQAAAATGQAQQQPDTPAAVERRAAAVKQFVQERLGLDPVEESKAYITFLVARDKEALLNGFLRDLEASRDTLGITDVQLSLTSLEEVFLNIARRAEMEAAAVSGQRDVTHTMDDGTRMQIPIGAELVAHPQTGVHYKVRWGTDEAGRLIIMDASPVAPPQPQMGAPGMPPPYGPGAYVPGGAPLAAPVPAPALAAGHYPPHPPASMSADPAGAYGQNVPQYPGYYPSPHQSGAAS
ncbi:hypothetical protein GPECTOR_11g253 [Gonium pectorale]|uniref:ABC transporter domain-containing protein n=1 Tax=Gonium pectorale TaxID=33097 RepID=A0A150GPZ8_GONPE|nr:hypothetical protein GPECTOR_11g253 [Gonium pectorale]|eukprot:KXZ51812.1 hypothetical protein GPECTOR_11g253 [Gonium pectorale]